MSRKIKILKLVVSVLVYQGAGAIDSFLLLPYILWVSFASVLNFSIMILNL